MPNEKPKRFSVEWLTAMLFAAVLGVSAIAGHLDQKHEIRQVQAQQQEIMRDQDEDREFNSELDKQLAVLQEHLDHADHEPHIPGSVCICFKPIIRSTASERAIYDIQICEFGEQCDEAAVTACEAVYVDFRCQPLS